MPKVFFLCSTKIKSIIQINNNKLTNKLLQDLIHQLHEGARCICQSKWHDHPFIQSTIGLESCLPLISFFDPDLMVTTLQINLFKVGFPTQTVHHVIHPWHSELVLDYNLVNFSRIYAHPPLSIFLWAKYRKDNTWTQALPY